MNMIKGIYHNGIIEPIEKPKNNDLAEVIIIFPDTGKKVKKIKGIFQDQEIDYNQIDQDLKELNKDIEKNLSGKI